MLNSKFIRHALSIGLFGLSSWCSSINAAVITLTVTNTGDASGASSCLGGAACSLRQAITAANATSAANNINFNIAGIGPHVIAPTTALPAITTAITINGYSQSGSFANTTAALSGSNATLKIILNGINAPLGSSGLSNSTGSLTVSGLSIVGFRRTAGAQGGHGIGVSSNSSTVVSGCFIGVQPNGILLANQGAGVHIGGGSGSTAVGGAAAADRNILSANQTGVHAVGSIAAVSVTNNLIGMGPTGVTQGNSFAGVALAQSGGVVRGNVIAGSANGYGITLSDASDSALIVGNRIGTAALGTEVLGNTLGGILLQSGENGSFGHQIGTSDEPNVIAFNTGPGIELQNSSSQNSPQSNVLAFNRFYANEIFIPRPDGAASSVAGTSSGLAIELLPIPGPTPNDLGDVDQGPNALQNFPVLASANRDTLSGEVSISGTLNSAPGSYRLVFYANRSADGSGFGEGEFLSPDTVDVTVPVGGGSSFVAFNQALTFPGAPATISSIAATATRLSNTGVLDSTSEMSANRSIVNVGPNVFTVSKTADTNDGACNSDCSLREAITAANSTANNASAADHIRFAIPGAGPHAIVLSALLPAVTQAVLIDGYSQAGAIANSATDDSNNAVLKIGLRNFGLSIASTAGNSTVRGLSILTNVGGQAIQAGDAHLFRLEGCWLGVDFDGSAGTLTNGVNMGPNGVLGGASAAARNVIVAASTGAVVRSGGQVQANLFGVRPNGSSIASSNSDGLLMLGSGALVSNNRLSGFSRAIQVLPTAGGNQYFGNRIIGNAVAALVNASDQQLVGNTLAACSTIGISIMDTIRRTTLAQNRITNCGIGTDLVPLGPTLNDPGDLDTGANDLQNFPVLTAAARNGDLVTVQGTLNSLANTQFRIRFCGMASPATNLGGCDQGQIGTHLSVQTNALGNANFSAVLALPEGGAETHISASAGRLLGPNTDEGSEFSLNRAINENNTPPVFSPNANGFTRQAGSTNVSGVIFGSVTDLETPVADLTISATAGGTASGFAIGVFNVAGNVQGTVSALCNASAGTIRLEVSDAELSGSDDIALVVTPNTPPSLSYAANVQVAAAAAASIAPSAPPSDTGTLSSVQLQSQGGYTGSISVNAAGVLTLANAGPVGTHTIVVRATDNCGASTDVSFVLTVNAGELLRDGFE